MELNLVAGKINHVSPNFIPPTFKGAVCRYCFDAKSFNLTACFIMKCYAICYYYMLKIAAHGQQCAIM